MAAKRRCKAKTKAGKRCKAAPLKDGDVCLAHADADTRSSMQFVGGGPGSGRPKTPRVVDIMRERVEERLDEILKPYFDQLTGAVHIAKFKGEVTTSDVPDTGARIEAAERLLDRVYGRPAQTITGEGGGPIRASLDVDDPEVRKLAAQLLHRRAAAASGS